MDKIAIKGLHKTFGSNHVLQGIDIAVEKGKSLVVIGGSGSGKSVLLKSIIGLISPDKGSIMIDQMETARLSRRGRDSLMQKFGVLFQGGALFDSLTVWENITFGLVQNGEVTKEKAKYFAIEKLQMVGLGADVAEKMPSELSGGMQKRVALARAVARDPEIIFFDEPTTGLDPITSDVINDLIISCSKAVGATTLTITHDMASVRKIADTVAMIHEGKIIWHGNINELDTSGNAYVDQFIHGKAEGPIKLALQDHLRS